MSLLNGQIIKGYELREQIGAGGFGAVYRAFQPSVEREVAIKVILPELASRPDFIRRFEIEAQLVARLEHLHIVPLYDYWREPDGAYLVMRYLRGGSLRHALTRGPFSAEAASRILDQIAGALAAAHRQGVVHRDLKPDNIIFDDDNNAYLTDFGIAKDVTRATGMTEADAVSGSLAYISPEQAKSEPVTPLADLYSLGVVMYELLTGEHPFPNVTPTTQLLKHLTEPLPSLQSVRVDLPAALNDVIQRVTAKPPNDRYPDALAFAAAFREALGGIAPVAPSLDLSAPLEVANPYKGLHAFHEADAADFFGREALTEQLVKRLADSALSPQPSSRFQAVVGPSGSGKSSVVKAGLIPALRRGALPGSEKWFIVEMIPGAHPLEELEIGLLRIAARQPAGLMEQLQHDERSLLRAARLVLPDDDSELLLVVDQFEELFTLVEDKAETAHFLNLLYAAVTDSRSRARVVVTLRADFYDRPLLFPNFSDLMRQHTEVVVPLTSDELAQAIREPAERVGAALETGLVTAILADVNQQPGALPLLQYALTELFERREGRLLTKAAYQSIGGVSGALAKRAEEVYASLDEAGQSATRQLFLRLVTLGEGTEDTRRRVLRSEVEGLQVERSNVQTFNAVVEAFGKSRLLSFDRDPVTRGPTVEVAHEALLREWRRLREWLTESRDDLRLQRLLAYAAAEWNAANRDSSFILAGSRLEQFEGWAAESAVALTQEEQAYLDASIAERERQQAGEAERQQRELAAARKLVETERARAEAAQKAAESEKRRAEDETQSANRLRARNRLITAVGAIALVLAVLAGAFGLQSRQNATRAETNLGVARAANTQAVANAATAQAEARSRSTQQAVAQANFARAESLRLAAEANALLSQNGSAETATLLGVRALQEGYSPQADAILERALTRLYYRHLLRGHTNWVNAVAFSPDGHYALTGGLDRTARLWDVNTGQEIRQFIGHTAGVSAVAFSPDGKYVLTGSDDQTARLWEAGSGTALLTFTGHTSGVSAVAFSPDGQTVLTGSGDKTARLWEAATGQALRMFTGHTGLVSDVAFSPDGKFVLTGSFDNTARLWDAGTGQELRAFTGHFNRVRSVAFSPDGKSVLTGSDDWTARLWDTGTGQELRAFSGHTNFVNDAAFSPDGKYVLTGSDDRTARIWDAQSGAEVRQFVGHTANVRAVAFAPDGRYVLTGSEDQTARLWAAPASPELRVFDNQTSKITSVAFSPDGKYVLTGSEDKVARLWDAVSDQEIRAFTGHTKSVRGVAFSPDGRYVLTGSDDHTARLWDVATGQVLRTFTGSPVGVSSVAFSPDGKYVLTTGAEGLFSSGEGGFTRLWDAGTGQELRIFDAGPGLDIGAVSIVAFSPDGKSVLIRGFNSVVYLFDTGTGQELRTFDGHTSYVRSVAFSPDGKYVLTGSEDKTARLWDAATGQELRIFTDQTSIVISVAFSPDGKYVLTGHDNNTARLWDVATGQELRQFIGHTGPVNSAAFSSDGKYVITGSEDGTARLWDTDYHDTIRFACSLLWRDFTGAERIQNNLADKAPTCP